MATGPVLRQGFRADRAPEPPGDGRLGFDMKDGFKGSSDSFTAEISADLTTGFKIRLDGAWSVSAESVNWVFYNKFKIN